MQWIDDGIVIGVRLHGETAVIAELLTQAHGRHLGFVHGGRSRRLRPVLQPGNRVRASWQSRQENGLGTLSLEPLVLRAAAVMETALSLQAANLVCALMRQLPEREPHALLYAMADAILDHVDDRRGAAQALVRFELTLLQELGFGLDLSRCALTGAAEDLAYVSPKSGRAVTRAAGDSYRDRILELPAFLVDDGVVDFSGEELLRGFTLTGHFLSRDVFRPSGSEAPDCRAAYLEALARTLRSSSVD